ncbi:hypothetical protein DFA_07509 [Cavenderia fasciculata]|uniref:Uncharacterized protein n=1 Tax=Cavenderia fasciculata TaxID=261658 RepID=F4PWM1_CACFS|nr:uncharacterized protein DFA_07509 [Cavenderia fasciculata]EGG20385.1 hypothetical protein DFA_07509 [Cavenderia fasciculata]|eukprot:XP_004367368.1 hypothetical protein DFA_07509 [Cavenderia fasciculata]
MALSKLENQGLTVRSAVSGFFNVGEWVAAKSINFTKTKISQYKLDDYPLRKPKD